MAQNIINLKNNTPAPVEISMYIGGEATGRTSVVWLQTFVPPNGPGVLLWDDQLAAAAAKAEGDVLSVVVSEEALPGSRWNLDLRDSVLALEHVGMAPEPDQVTITNRTGARQNPGLAVGGSGAMFYRNVLSATTAVFELQRMHYWIVATLGARIGQAVPDVPMLSDPVQIVFPPLLNAAFVTITAVGTELRLDVKYAGDASIAL